MNKESNNNYFLFKYKSLYVSLNLCKHTKAIQTRENRKFSVHVYVYTMYTVLDVGMTPPLKSDMFVCSSQYSHKRI